MGKSFKKYILSITSYCFSTTSSSTIVYSSFFPFAFGSAFVYLFLASCISFFAFLIAISLSSMSKTKAFVIISEFNSVLDGSGLNVLLFFSFSLKLFKSIYNPFSLAYSIMSCLLIISIKSFNSLFVSFYKSTLS